MIATHNIKVNGRWILAGQEYDDPAEEPKTVSAEPVAEEPVNEDADMKVAAPKRTASRRKATAK